MSVGGGNKDHNIGRRERDRKYIRHAKARKKEK